MALVPLIAVTLDCPDPRALATFYREIAGGDVVYTSEEFVALACEPVTLGFQRASNPAASWPDPAGPLRAHLEFAVPDADRLDDLEARVVAFGARRPSIRLGPRCGGYCSTLRVTCSV